MIPSKPEKSSRRSSILKLPKPRQPFQTVEGNGLSAEDSPMKLKRRVSFAEKKHVKEFCDSMEQGTVWDNTYEESELSFPKSHPPVNTDNNPHIQVLSERSVAINYQSLSRDPADDSLNLLDFNNQNNHQSKKILIRQNAVDLDYLPIEAIRSRLEPGDIPRVIVSANPELLENKENIPAVLAISRIESSLIEDEELPASQKFAQNFSSQSFSVYCDDNMEDENEDGNLLNKTDHQNISMDCTLPATESILSSHIDDTINKKEFVNSDEVEKTQVFHDNAMEMTEVVTSNLCTKSTEIQNRKSILCNKSMEITEAVPASYFTVKQLNIRPNVSMEISPTIPPPSTMFMNQQQIVNDTVQLSRPPQFPEDKTQFFNNKSMEMTEAIPSIRPGQFSEIATQVFPNKSKGVTVPVSLNPSGPFHEDRTQLFNNKSMEITESVSSKRPVQLFEDKTQVFNDKSMEMTEAVPSLRQFSGNKTQIFHNKSMEITESLLSRRPVQFFEDRTQMFNKSMEMTEAVSSIRPEQFSENKTQVFHDNSMEMTEAVTLSNHSSGQIFQDKTQLFNNKSMEITESVLSQRQVQFFEDRTQVFNNKSMEMTETVSSSKLPEQFFQDKTQVFHNKSMEITEAVVSVPFLSHSEQIVDNRNQVLDNKSMELTEVLPANRQTQFSGNKTQIYHNISMDITDAVTSVPVSRCRGQFPEDSTQVFHNKSMDMTEAVPSIIPEEFSSINPQIFNNNPMEVIDKTATTASPSILKHPEQIPEHQTQLFTNKSMEMTEVVTEYSHNYCMEHTEIIPSLKRQYQQIFNENEKIDGVLSSPNAKNSRDNSNVQKRQISEKDAETLHRLLHQNLDESGEKSILESQNSANIHNQSMEMTAAVPAHFTTSRYLDQQNLSPQNISMELTQAIPSFINKKNRTINNPDDELIASVVPETNPVIEVTTSHTTSNNNFDESMEKLRFRASLISNCHNDDITYNFTAPIRSGKVNENNSNDLEKVEAPSFVYADISDEIPAFETQQQTDEETLSIPNISITENFYQLENRRLTHVIIRKEPEENVEINESINNVMNKNFETSPIEFDNYIEEGKNVVNKNTVCLDTNLDQNKVLTAEYNQNTERRRRRTYVVDNDENSAMLQRRKIIRSGTYVINTTRINANDDIIVENDESKKSSELEISPCLSPTQSTDLPSLQLNMLEKSIVSPVKKINVEFASVTENDLIFARIEKQRRIEIEKKRAKMEAENQLMVKNIGESMESVTKNYIKNRFDILTDQLNEIATNRDCIWKVYSMTPKVICIEYCMTALIIEIIFNVPEHPNELEIIERVRIIPRISDEENAILRMTDRLIVQTIDVENLRKNYKTYDDVLQLIECVTNDVNKIYDFYHDLKRLSRLNSMEISLNKISFNLWTKQMNIILKISMNIKPFANIQPEDIDVQCLLGSVRTNDVKDLIKNTKRNYNFLRLYINDIKDYIELMEISTASRK